MITFTREATKDLKKLPATIKARILGKIQLLDSNPSALAGNIKRLQGVEAYRLRVGDWRVIYTEDGTILTILKIKPRGGAY